MSLTNAKQYATTCYNFNDISDLGKDSVSNNDLTDNNTVGSATGKFSNCAQFVSANSESLSVLHSSANSPGNSDFTVSFWLKLTSKSASQMLVYKSSGGSGEYAIGYGSGSDRLYVQVFGSINFGTLTQVVANNFGSPPTDTWMLVVVTHDATADVVSISVDGGTADTGSHTAGIYQPGVGTLRIGADNFSSGYADACIDDLTILIGYALDSTETSELYNNGIGIPFSQWNDTRIPNRPNSGPCAPLPVPPDLQLVDWTNPINKDSVFAKGLKGFWLAGGPGWKTDRWYDISGNNNHGTLTNMVPSEDWVGDAPKCGFGSLDFDGSNDRVNNTGGDGSTFSTSSWSLSCWIYLNPTTSSYDAIIGFDSVSGIGRPGFNIYPSGSFEYWDGSVERIFSSGMVVTEQWIFTTLNYTGSDLSLFVNGQKDPVTHSYTRNGTFPVNFGYYDTGFQYLDGKISSVLYHSPCLSDNQCYKLYSESLQSYPTLLNHTSYFRAPAKRSFISVGYAPSEPTITDMDLVDWSDPINRDCVFAKGLKGFWLAGDKSWKTDRWYDISGNNNHGTLTNMVPSEDWVGDSPKGGFGSLDFDGSNDYVGPISIPSVNSVPATFTVALWFRGRTTVNNGGRLFEKGANSEFALNWSGSTSAKIQIQSFYDSASLVTTNAYSDLAWHHCIISRKNGDSLRLYIDGQLDKSSAVGNANSSTGDFNIGRFGGGGFVHSGWLDGILLHWGVAADDKMASTLYQESLQRYPALLKRYTPQPYTNKQVRRGVTVQVPEWEEEEPTLQNVDWSQPLNTDSVFAKGLKGFYLAGDQSWKTDRWYDLSGNGNHGVLTAMTPSIDWNTDNKPEGAVGHLSFGGGTNERVSLASAVTLTSPWSLFFRAYRQNISGDNFFLGNDANNYLQFNTIAVLRVGYSGNTRDFTVSNYQQWVNALLVQANGRLSLYIDGKLLYNYAMANGSIIIRNIGYANSSTDNFVGHIPEVLFWEGIIPPSIYEEVIRGYPTLLRRHTTQSYAVPAEVTSQITNYTLVVDSVSYSWTPQDTNLEYNRIFPADSVSYTWTPQAVTFAISILMSAESATYTWTPQNVNLEYNRNLVAESSSYTWTPQDTNLEYHYSVVADSATYTWTPQTVNLEYHYNLVAESVGYSWTPQDSNLEYNRNLVAESVTYTWSPQDVTLSVSGGTITMAADGVTYSWTPQDVNTEYHRLLSAESISYTWTPQDVTLSVTGAGVITMVADGVSYSWTPQVVNLEYHHNLIPDAPTYTWTPQATNLEQNKYLSAESVGYTWTPQDVQFQYHYNLPSESLSYAWTPQDTNLEYHRIFNTESVSYTWTPQAVSFSIGLILSAEPVSYSWSVQDTSLIYSRVLTAASATYTWTVQDVTFFAGVLVPPPIIEVTINFVHTQNSIINFQRTQNRTIDFGGGQ